MKKYLSCVLTRNFWIPVFAVILYIAAGFGLSAFLSDAVLVSLLLDVLILLVCLFFYYIRPNVPYVRVHPDGFSMRVLWKSLLLVGFVFIFFYTQYAAVVIHTLFPDSAMEAYTDLANSNLGLYVFISVFFAPLSEEFLYRGLMYRFWCHFDTKSGSFSSKMVAFFASSLLFGLSHGTISHLALATVFGMYLCVIFELTGNIWVCVALHSVYNIAALSFYVPVPKALLSIYFVAGVALALIVFFMLCITYSDRIFSIAYMSDVTEDHRVPCPRCDSEHVKVYKKNLLFRRKARGRYLLSYQCKHCGWMANVSETGHEGFFNGKPVV